MTTYLRPVPKQAGLSVTRSESPKSVFLIRLDSREPHREKNGFLHM